MVRPGRRLRGRSIPARKPDARSPRGDRLTIAVGPPALVNEFHDPGTGFHQIDLYFRCTLVAGRLDPAWTDPEGVVTERRFFARAELEGGGVRFKPDSLPEAAWGTAAGIYDPLEVILK